MTESVEHPDARPAEATRIPGGVWAPIVCCMLLAALLFGEMRLRYGDSSWVEIVAQHGQWYDEADLSRTDYVLLLPVGEMARLWPGGAPGGYGYDYCSIVEWSMLWLAESVYLYAIWLGIRYPLRWAHDAWWALSVKGRRRVAVILGLVFFLGNVVVRETPGGNLVKGWPLLVAGAAHRCYWWHITHYPGWLANALVLVVLFGVVARPFRRWLKPRPTEDIRTSSDRAGAPPA